MKSNFINILIIALLLLVQRSDAQVISQLSFYSPLISTFDMKYTNNHLVVSQNGLLIFDVTNPNDKPKLVAQTSYPGSTAYTIDVHGSNAYMAHGNNGIFAVYDISNFNAPVLKGSVPIPATSFYVYGDIEPYGNYVYVSGVDSLYIVDVSNPSSPFVANAIGVAHTQFNGAEEIAIERNTLFLRTPFSIYAYNITDPVLPRVTDTIPNSHAYNNGLAVDTINHRLFSPWLTALQDFTGFDTYDVSDPSQIHLLFSDSIAPGSGDFGVIDYSYFNNVVFISRSGSINAFNVSDSAHGFVTDFSGEDIPNASVSIQVRDSVLFHARGGGIEVLKYSNTPVSVCVEPDGLRQKVVGTTAFLYWNKKPSAKAYVFRYRTIGTNDWNYVSSKDNVAKLQNLTPGKTYTWEVRSICGAALKETSDWSLYNVFYVQASDINSLITVAPNPVKDVMHLHIKDLLITQIQITDLAGSSLIKINSVKPDENISLSKLKTGTYLLQLSDNSNRIMGVVKIFKE